MNTPQVSRLRPSGHVGMAPSSVLPRPTHPGWMDALRVQRRWTANLLFWWVILLWCIAGIVPRAQAQSSALSGATNLTPGSGAPTLPIEITSPGTYYLSQNLVVNSTTTDGIDIYADNVTVDLNGHTITTLASGTSYNMAVHNYGICTSNHANVAIRNGTVNGFMYGVFIAAPADSSGAYNDSVSYGHLIENINLNANTVAGICLLGGDSVVRACQVNDTGGSTVQDQGDAFGIVCVGPSNLVEDCGVKNVSATASGSFGYGVCFLYDSTDCFAVHNQVAGAYYGVFFDISATGKYARNLTAPDVTMPFSGNTDAGGNQAPVVTSTLNATAQLGTAFSYQITANNVPTSFSASGLPAGLSVSTTSGQISGTPTQTGLFRVTLSASNTVGTGTAVLTLTIPAVVTSSLTATGKVGNAFSYQVTASNAPTSYAAAGLPPGVGINTSTGLISGTPTQAGAFNVVLTVVASGGTGTATLVLTIQHATPAVTSETVTGTFGSSFGYQIQATNSPTSFTASGLPSGLSLDGASGLISGTLTTLGTFTITLHAANDGGAGTGTLTLVVNPPPPVITSLSLPSGQVGQPYSFTITASNTPTSFAASGLPAGLSMAPSTGMISGTPTVAAISTVSLSATNAGGTGNATVSLTVNPPTPVITSSTSASAQVGVAFSYQIAATNNPTSFGAANLPAGLSINSSNGLVSGTPIQAGTFMASLSATNAGGTGAGSLTLTIAVARPVVSSATVQGQVGVAFSYQITATNAPTIYAASNLPAGLTLDTATGLISGTPTVLGTYPVGISASNAGGTGTGSLSLTITAPPIITSAMSASGSTGTAFSYQIVASNSPDFFAADGLPSGLSCDPQTGLITGTPTQVGAYTVVLTASNVAGSGTLILYLTVRGPDDTQFASQSVPGEMLTGQNYTVSVTFLNSGSTTWTSGSYQLAYDALGSNQPSCWGVAQVTLAGTVAPQQNATFSFTVTAPMAPGHYRFCWQLAKTTGGTGFGQNSPDYTVYVGTQPSTAGALQNASFEQPVLTSGTYQSTPTNTGWNFIGSAGVTSGSSLYASAAIAAPQGTQAAYLQATGAVSQTTASLAAGTYLVGFRTAQSSDADTQQISVSVGSKVLGYFTPPGTGYAFYTTAPFTVTTAGAVTLSFTGLNPNGGDNAALVDDVRLFPVAAAGGTPHGGTATALPGAIAAIDFDEGGQDVGFGESTPYNLFVANGGVPNYRDTAVDIAPSPEAGGQYSVEGIDPGEYLNYTVNVATTGNYHLTVHGGALGGGTFRTEVDGVDVSGLLAMPLPVAPMTGSNVSPATDVALIAGSHMVRLVSLSGGMDLEWFSFVQSGAGTPGDSDGNGIADDWEMRYLGHLGVDPTAMPDGDGMTLLQKYQQRVVPGKKDNPALQLTVTVLAR